MTDVLDRNSSSHAAAALTDVCRSDSDRLFVLTVLLDSLELAETIGRNSYAATLFANGFRLNVGSVEALTFFDGELGVFLRGPIPDAPWRRDVEPCTLKNAPGPAFLYAGSVRAVRRHWAELKPLHEEYVRGAAVTTKGKPRRSPYAKFHSPGLITFARTVVPPRHTTAAHNEQ